MGARPEEIQNNNQHALQLFQSGKLKEAQKKYQKTLKWDPRNPEALHLLGLIHHANRDFYAAEKSIRQAIRSNPQYWAAHNNLSVVLQEAGKLDEALAVLQKLVQAQPSYADAQRNLGIVLGQLGQTESAVAALSASLALAPNVLATEYALAQVYRQSNQLENAVVTYQKILQAQPTHRDTLYQYAQCLAQVGNKDLALEQLNIILRGAVNDPEALLLQGSLLQSQGHLEEAKLRFEQVLAAAPTHLEAKQSLAGNCLHRRHYAEARGLYAEIQQTKGKYPAVHSLALLAANYTDDDAHQATLDQHRRYEKLLHRLPVKSCTRSLSGADLKQRKIRLGFVSADFYYHSVAYFFSPLLDQLDRNRFEVVCYYNNVRDDVYTQRIKQASDQWRHIASLSDQECFEQVVNDDIDVLIDLSGHTAGHRLPVFAHRAAPVQVSWLGYPNTSGLSQMDFRLVDEFTDPLPESDAWHTEQLVHLPNFLCYQAPDDAPALAPPPCLEQGMVTFGSFNNLVKVTDPVLDTWARILEAVPRSRLILKSSQLGDSSVCKEVMAVFTQRGIESERIQLIGRLHDPADHLKLYQQVDIGLDPFPYNGTTTTFEALWMGVPTLVLEGDRHASRVGLSIMHHLELSDWVAQDDEHYVKLASDKANDLESLAGLKRQLRERLSSSVLCDAPSFARNFESAIEVLVNSKLT